MDLPHLLWFNIPVSITKDDLFEPDETITLSLDNTVGTLFISNTKNEYTLTIANDDQESEINFLTRETFTGEAGSPTETINLGISPAIPVSGNVTITIIERNGVAEGTDFTTSPPAAGSTITLPVSAGSTLLSFDVNILNDADAAFDEYIDFVIADPPGPNTMVTGGADTHSVYITEGTRLERGDLAIVGFNYNTGSGTDEISFVCFKDITPGTTLDFTENAYNKCTPGIATSAPGSGYRVGGFGQSEGWFRWTFSSGTDIPAGQVITLRIDAAAGGYSSSSVITPLGGRTYNFSPLPSDEGTYTGGNFNMNPNGEQVFICQGGSLKENGTTGTPAVIGDDIYDGGQFLYIFNTKGNIWTPICGNSAAGGTKNSDKPEGMDCFTAYPSASADRNKYDGPLASATQRDWISRFNDPTNWATYSSESAYNSGGNDYRSSFSFNISSGSFEDGVWVGDQNTDWFDCGNWQSLTVPDPFTNVVIDDAAFRNVQVNDSANCRDIVIENGRILTLNSTNSLLNVNGNFERFATGGLNQTDGVVRFTGNANARILSNEVPFLNMEINKAGRLTLDTNVTITGNLDLNGGDFLLNGNTLELNSATVTESNTNSEISGVARGSRLSYTGSGNADLFILNVDQLFINRTTTDRINVREDVILRGDSLPPLRIESGVLNITAGNKVTVNDSTPELLADGNYQGTSTSSLEFLGNDNAGSIKFISTGANLGTLTINTTGVGNTATLENDLTIDETLNLSAGVLDLNGNELTVNNRINEGNGSMQGGGSSSLIIGKQTVNTPATTIPEIAGGLNSLTVSRDLGVALGANLSVSNQLTMGVGDLITNTDTLDLGTTGSITGEDQDDGYVKGFLRSEKTINNSTSSFGGIGFEMTSVDNLAATEVIRVAGPGRQLILGVTKVFSVGGM